MAAQAVPGPGPAMGTGVGSAGQRPWGGSGVGGRVELGTMEGGPEQGACQAPTIWVDGSEVHVGM